MIIIPCHTTVFEPEKFPKRFRLSPPVGPVNDSPATVVPASGDHIRGAAAGLISICSAAGLTTIANGNATPDPPSLFQQPTFCDLK